MARPKKAAIKAPVSKTPKDPRIEEIYEEVVEFNCPIRGRIKQKVKIKRFKSLTNDGKAVINSKDEIDAIEEKDDGLSMYSDEDEPQTSKPPGED